MAFIVLARVVGRSLDLGWDEPAGIALCPGDQPGEVMPLADQDLRAWGARPKADPRRLGWAGFGRRGTAGFQKTAWNFRGKVQF